MPPIHSPVHRLTNPWDNTWSSIDDNSPCDYICGLTARSQRRCGEAAARHEVTVIKGCGRLVRAEEIGGPRQQGVKMPLD